MSAAFFLSGAVAFVLNVIWEHLHASLYVSYMNAPITNAVLLHASVADAVMVAMLVTFALFLPKHFQVWGIGIGGLLLAVLIEGWALNTGRWMYTSNMPLLPLLHVGLTPTLQLATTGLATLYIIHKCRERYATLV